MIKSLLFQALFAFKDFSAAFFMKKSKFTPQEKKILSYRKDRRNMYGESRSRSRFAIAKRRAKRHQTFRHHQKQIIAETIKTNADFDSLLSTEKALKIKGWRKVSDESLGEFVSVLLGIRKTSGSNKELKTSGLLKQAERYSPKPWRNRRWERPED